MISHQVIKEATIESNSCRLIQVIHYILFSTVVNSYDIDLPIIALPLPASQARDNVVSSLPMYDE